jgi:hypothetical protein
MVSAHEIGYENTSSITDFEKKKKKKFNVHGIQTMLTKQTVLVYFYCAVNIGHFVNGKHLPC